MSTLFRLAVVGCGRIASSHVQAILQAPSAQLTALIDPVEERARALARRYGLEVRVTPLFEDVLNDVDGVVIATPNHTHGDVAELCVRHGIPALIEKPLAVSVAEGLRICHVAEETGVTVAVGYVSRFRENVQLLGQLLRDGRFGRVRRFLYQAGTRGGWAPLSAYNLDRKATGGGVLVVTGTHFLDRMLDWFGYPVTATLRDDSAGGPESNAVATFEFQHPSGPIAGLARFSKSVALEAGIVLETDAGTVVLKDRPDAQVLLRPSDKASIEMAFGGRRAWPVTARPGEFVLQLEDFVASVREKRAPMVSARQGLQSLRLLETLYAHREPLASEWYAAPVAVGAAS